MRKLFIIYMDIWKSVSLKSYYSRNIAQTGINETYTLSYCPSIRKAL